MEIERKFLIPALPDNIDSYQFRIIEQAYLCTEPVVRVRRDNNDYYLTYKSAGLMVREELNLPLTKNAYEHLIRKADGNIIRKKRYLIPSEHNLTIELDIFEAPFADLLLAEVEFSSVEEADSYITPDWFGEDVTLDGRYHNSYLSQLDMK